MFNETSNIENITSTKSINMKKQLSILFYALFLNLFLNAQDNTFPSSGYVGIGTTNPTSHFSAGSLIHLKSLGNSEIVLDHSDGGTTSDIGILSFERNSDHLAHIRAQHDGSTDSAFLSFHTQTSGGSFSNINSNERMRIASNGYVGVGTTNPVSQFDVRATNGKGIWLNFNDESAVTFRPNNGNSIFHLSHGHDNKFYISQGGTVGANKLMTFVNSGNVGIGTTNPKAVLDVGSNIQNEALGTVFGRLPEGDTTGDGTYLGVKGYGTQNSVYDGKSFSIVHNFYGTTNSSINFFRGGSITGGYLTFNTNSNTEGMRLDSNGNLAIGTTYTQGFKLGVNGNIAALEVKIATYANWPDYVFKDTYNLPALEDVEQQIKDKGHLKDLPSAEEVKEEGFYLGDMDAKLLQKIEELTLYTIEQEKRIKSIEVKNEKLEEENQVLKSLLERVEKLEQNIKS